MEGETRKKQTPEKTRERILEAAFELFAECGFDATSIADVADAAKVRKSLVLYHFESKETLWQTAVTYRARPLVELIERYVGDAQPPMDLKGMIEGRFRLIQSRPEISRIMAWISLDPIRLTPYPMRTLGPRAIGKAVQDLAPRGAQLGIEPDILGAMAMGAMDGWFRYRTIYQTMALIPDEGSGHDDRFLAALLRLVSTTTEVPE